MCFDRRGRFSTRRVAAGSAGTLLGFLLSALISYVFLSEHSDAFQHPVEPGPSPGNFGVRCFVALSGNYSDAYVDGEIAAVRTTWGRRCSSLAFTRSYGKDEAGAWREAIHQANETGQFGDWIVLTGLNTYVVMENLKKMVQLYTISDTSRVVWAQEFNGKQLVPPPLILSHQGIRTLSNFLERDSDCLTAEPPQFLGACLKTAGFTVGDSRDEQLQHRMMPSSLRHLFRTYAHPYPDSPESRMVRRVQPGIECCSPNLVSIAGLTTSNAHFYDYMLNKVTVDQVV